MSLRHDEVLADIERRVRSDGASLEEIDCRIADELGVPSDFYFAYWLVWGAIEAYREARDLTHPGWLTAEAPQAEPALRRAQSLAESIGWLASTMYQDAVALNGRGKDVADHAGSILGAALQLRQNLRDVEAAATVSANEEGQQVRP